MKRFLTRLSRLLFIVAVATAVAVAFILLGILVMRVGDLSTQVAALSTRVHEIEQAMPGNAGRGGQTGGPSRTPTPTVTATPTGGSQGVAPSRTPTRTPRPTNTPTSTRTPTATATPSDPYFIVNSAWVNVRTGPGNNYPIINAVPRGDRYDIIARNRGSSLNTTWIEFCCVDDQQGWIYAGLVDLSVDWSTIRISDNIPDPPTFTPTPTSTPTPTRPGSGGNGSGGNDGMKGLPPIREGPENRCSHYDSDLYPYSQSVEPRIVNQQRGLIYGPYTGTYFASMRETDIEHIVARSEAHDSGLCAASSATRRAFANDLLNLTLASPSVNRHQKVAKDLAQWLPPLNECWYVAQVVKVKDKYNLTMDQAEAAVARRVIASCPHFDMIYTDRGAVEQQEADEVKEDHDSNGTDCARDPLGCYDDNNNGRITCAEGRAHGIAPVPRGHPAYQYMRDGDNDGVVCE